MEGLCISSDRVKKVLSDEDYIVATGKVPVSDRSVDRAPLLTAQLPARVLLCEGAKDKCYQSETV